MALEVDMHDEITSYRAKVFLGMSWRQLACVGAGFVIAGGISFVVSRVTAESGSWNYIFEAFTEGYGSIVFFVLMMPFAFIGWARPYGLKPEVFAKFFIRHMFGKKVLTYGEKNYSLSSRRSEVKRLESGKFRKQKEKRLRRALSETQSDETSAA